MKVFHLIDALDYSGSAQQLCLLGPALTHDVRVEICCLGPSHPWEERLRQQGIAVHSLQWTRRFDPSALCHLRRRLQQSSADVIHVWRLPALRALALVAPSFLSRVVLSSPLSPQGQLSWWDRWLVQRVRCLAVAGMSDQQRCLRQGLAAATLHVIPPAIDNTEIPGTPLPPGAAPTIVGIGNLEQAENFRQAVWAFDILRHYYADACLRLVGTGSQRAALEDLVDGLGSSRQIQFLGAQADIAPVLRSATAVWIPSSANCGRQVALDAMAAGCAVIASDVPCLREVILPEETGYLVPVGEVVPMARQTHLLIREPGLRARLGQTARRHVAQQYALSEAARRWRDLYGSVAA